MRKGPTVKKAVVVCVAALVALLGMPAAQAVAVPAAEQQLNWLADASGRVPVSDTEIREHVATVLDLFGGPAGFNAALTQVGRLTVEEILAAQPDQVAARVGGATGRLQGLMDGGITRGVITVWERKCLVFKHFRSQTVIMNRPVLATATRASQPPHQPAARHATRPTGQPRRSLPVTLLPQPTGPLTERDRAPTVE
jgi:hypothetical protein